MNEGDVILLDFEGWTSDPEELFDTTREKLAKEHDIFEEKRNYGPMVALVGGGRMVEGLEEHLKEAEVGQDYEVTVPAEKAYGPTDPKLFKLHRRREIEAHLREQAERRREPPMPLMKGVEVELDGKAGHIVMVSGSRVRVDFNHHLAGKDLTFKYRITEATSDPAKKVAKLIKLDYPVEADFEVDVDDQKVARITLADICKYDSGWFASKMRVVASLRKWADVTDVHFIESFMAPPPTEIKSEEAKDAETGETEESEGSVGAEEAEESKDAETGEPKDSEGSESEGAESEAEGDAETPKEAKAVTEETEEPAKA